MWNDYENQFDSIYLVDTNRIKLSPAIIRFLERNKKKIDKLDYEMETTPGPAPLTKDIKEIDVFRGSPIKVKRDGDYYVILNGRHRFAAHLMYDFKKICVEIVPSSS